MGSSTRWQNLTSLNTFHWLIPSREDTLDDEKAQEKWDFTLFTLPKEAQAVSITDSQAGNPYFCCSKRGLEDKILVPKSYQNCATCGNPVDGLNCRSCAFMRRCLNEGWYTIHDENEILNTSESSNHNTNVVSGTQEPFVFNQDPGVNSSQSPLQSNHNCCFECGDSLDGIFCQRCTCKSCGNGAHIGYNCPPKALIISNPEQCNQTIIELTTRLIIMSKILAIILILLVLMTISTRSFRQLSLLKKTNREILQAQEDLRSIQAFLKEYDHIPPNEKCMALLLAEERFLKIKQVMREEQNQPEVMQELLLKLMDDLQILKGSQQERRAKLNLEEFKRDQRIIKELKKQITKEQTVKENMNIEEMRHEQQLVDHKIKEITNDLGYKKFQGEKIDEEYERDCEIRIRKLKQDFNIWGSEVRKKKQAYEEEKYSAACRYMLSVTCDDEDDYIPSGDIIA
ncbi:hypothetical protein Tco_0905817 [Tanacetum coccineum]